MNASRTFRIRLSTNRSYLILTVVYLAVLLTASVISCFFAYHQRRTEALSEINFTYRQLNDSYNQLLDDFYQIYMPIFEDMNDSPDYDLLERYYTSNQPLTITEQQKLSRIMKQLMIRDNEIQWLAIYSSERKVNYIMYSQGNGVSRLTDTFPYIEDIENKTNRMEVYGMQTVRSPANSSDTFAICGGSPNTAWEGSLIAGYSTAGFEQIVRNTDSDLESLRFLLTSNGQIVFDSKGLYDEQTAFLPDAPVREARIPWERRNLFVTADASGNRSSILSLQVEWAELFLYFHKNTLPILGIVLAFALLSIFVYTLMLQNISGEVDIIKNGLDTIAENNLDYRLPTDFNHSDLSAVAQAINQMTARLHENINRAYYFELKQKETELAELQAKFNPHFLYNSLEMLRNRCYQSGDAATAELITQLASIFRGFISSRAFIPFQEELAFSRRYFALLRARYGEQVQIRYDIETELLDYGVVRNILQPLIENYFVHGFDVNSQEENYICIRGHSIDRSSMCITVEDNGCGMTDEEMTKLNAELESSIRQSAESYGLKNLHQRLRLFYGPGYGLKIYHNGQRGLSLQMTVLKMTCEEYEKGKKAGKETQK